jgi:Domain of unknown function (DUF3303)
VEKPMKFMITWKVPPANYKDAVARFLKTGGPVPAGLKMLGRWHTTDGRGFLLVEGTDTALAENFAQWADLLEIEVAPVLEDAEAGAVLSKAFGK